MSFCAVLVFSILALCAGGVCGCLVCAVAGRVFHKPSVKADKAKVRFNAVCVLLSVSVASLAVGFIFIENFFYQMHLVCSHALFFLFVFACGLLCACFWKSFLPVFLVAYISFSLFTGAALYKMFGSFPDSVLVVAGNDSVTIDGRIFYAGETEDKKIAVNAYVLPSSLIVPLPRVWCKIIGIATSFGEADTGEVLRVDGFLARYSRWLIKNKKELFVDLPSGDALPSVYTLRLRREGENLVCNLSRNL